MKFTKKELDEMMRVAWVNHILPANNMDAKRKGWDILVDNRILKLVMHYTDCMKADCIYTISLGVVR